MIALIASLAASLSFGAAAPVGPVTSKQQLAPLVSMRPDVHQGTWLQLAGPEGERLVRIQEDGHLAAVALPPMLRGEDLQITPLRDGWTVAVDRYWPGGVHEEEACQQGSGSSASQSSVRVRSVSAQIAREAGEPLCSELVVAQLSPSGHWGDVRLIPHSFGRESEASEPVLTNNEIELAWSEGEDFQPIRVAVGRPGHDFGRDHLAREPLHREANRVITMVRHGALYLRGEYAPNPPFGTVRMWVDRRLYGNGTLGPSHFARGRVLREPGLSLEGANGSELWLFGFVYQSYAFARRPSWASTFEPTHLIVKESDGEEQFVQSQNHRTLITLDNALPHGRSEGGELEISPTGHLGRFHGVEAAPANTEYGLGLTGAINDAGSTLVATVNGEDAGTIWLHPLSLRCPKVGARVALTTTARGGTAALSAGRKGLFHIAWIDSLNQLQTSTVRVGC
ncbi:MAG TPA: hypothetical protein VHT25_08050 [Solirubrobacteraceae bacterium]|jgi:hypothetical protein|nr:hypothetical protein [Solirubrobacteraceae bacterium]